MSDPVPMRLPNLVIVGVGKAGTTSLFHYLRQHPDICGSDLKELRYLNPLRRGEPLAPLATYASHFAACADEKYAMEATPGYFYGGRPLARGLTRISPSAHALLSLREPADRCWSWFQFVKSRTRIPKDMTFTDYLDRCEDLHDSGTDGEVENQPFWGLGGGCYATWIDAWVAELGDRLRVVFFDDVTSDPQGSVKAICEWLAIDPTVVDDFTFSVTNKTVQYRNRLAQKGAVVVNRSGERFFHRHPTAKSLLRRAYYSVNKAPPHPTMSRAERDRLTAFYRPHTARLSEQLHGIGVSLPPAWATPSPYRHREQDDRR
jgi:hypothetical protein